MPVKAWRKIGGKPLQHDRPVGTTHFPNFFFPPVLMLLPGKAERAFFTALRGGEGREEKERGRGGEGRVNSESECAYVHTYVHRYVRIKLHRLTYHSRLHIPVVTH